MRRGEKVMLAWLKIALFACVVCLWWMFLDPIITPPGHVIVAAIFTIAATFVAAVFW